MSRTASLCSLSLALLLAAGCHSQSTTTEEAAHHEATPIETEGTEPAADQNDMAAPVQQEQPVQTPPPAPNPAAQQPSTAKPAAQQPSGTGTAAQQPSGTTATPPAATATAPPQPVVPMIEVPAGTLLQLELKTDLSSGTNVAGDEFKARVLEPVTMGGQVVIPERSRIWGTVTDAASAKKMTGQAHLSLAFEKVELPDGSMHALRASLTEEGVKVGKRTGAVIGGSAAGGALLGKIIGKDTKGAVKGALIGAAIGTGIAAAQKGQDLELPSGTILEIALEEPLRLPEPK